MNIEKVDRHRINIRIPEDIYQELSGVCSRLGYTVNGLIVNYILAGLEQQKIKDLQSSPEFVAEVFGKLDDKTRAEIYKISARLETKK